MTGVQTCALPISKGCFEGGTKIYHKDHQIICESIVQVIDTSKDWIKAALSTLQSERNRCSSIVAVESMKQTMIETQIK